ncbi:MAG: hypothetical protein OXS28_02610 [Gammaproteobacteria bacterium]|nr:hypothetical protein [Gammaproteobacteria bacterium]
MAAGSRGLTREMSITHKDFFRLLPRAVNGAPVTRMGNQADIATEAGRVKITLAPESIRKLGLMEFPVTPVSIEFDGFNPADQTAFLSRFDLAYQRGGG